MTFNPILTVFTKPWTEPLPLLADKVAALGLGGVELAVRPGYQVLPENVARDLPAAARIFAERGLQIRSVAGPIDEPTIAACGDAGVPIIRICCAIDMSIGYLASLDRYRRQFDALVPTLDRFGVAIGVQNHYGTHVGSAAGTLHLIEKYERKHVCAVLDMAHCSVDGEPTAMAVDIVKDRLNGLVNFKSAFHLRANGPGGGGGLQGALDDGPPLGLFVARARPVPESHWLRGRFVSAGGIQSPKRQGAAHGGRRAALPQGGYRAPEGDRLRDELSPLSGVAWVQRDRPRA